MFHLYCTRIKILVREKSNLFWTLLFPIILSIFFFVVLNNAYSDHALDTINIAIVNQTEDNSTAYLKFQEMMNNIEIADNKKMFNISYINEDKAKQLLEKNEITGYVIYEETLNLVVKDSGIYESIIKSVLETYAKTAKTISNILVLNGGQITNSEIEILSQNGSYIVNHTELNNPPNLVLNHYYSLVAMACLFGAMYGCREVSDIQANLSAKGARLNASPTSKLKLALTSILAALTLQLISILLLLAFLSLVLHVEFGNRIHLVLVASIVSSLTGVLLGTSIGSIVKKGEAFKSAIITAFSLFCCFLAGLMFVQMKYIVAIKIPFLNYINPASLITDSYYSLYFYQSLNRFVLNMIILSIINVALILITINATRRSSYASI